MGIEPKTIERVRDSLLAGGKAATASPACEELDRQGKLTAPEKAALGKVEPIIESMFLMMGADGVASRQELDVIWDAVKALTEDSLRGETIKSLVKLYGDQLKKDGWKTRVASVAESLGDDEKLAEAAFGLAAAVALADEEVTLEENTLVDQLADAFGLTDERCVEILGMVRESG